MQHKHIVEKSIIKNIYHGIKKKECRGIPFFEKYVNEGYFIKTIFLV